MYEPRFGVSYPPGAVEAAEAALAAGKREAVLTVEFDALGMSQDEIERLQSSPRWPTLLAGAHTVPRECRVEESWVYEPGRFDRVNVPTFLLLGSESPSQIVTAPHQAAEAIPGARIHVLQGHGHFATNTYPTMVVSVIQKFLTA